MIIIDTDVLIEIFDRRSERGGEALDKILKSGETISITVINLHEILYGLHKYAKPVQEIQQLPTIEYRKTDAALSARIELESERSGKPIRRTDSMIAAIAIQHSAHLYTFNRRHFQPFQTFGLKLFS